MSENQKPAGRGKKSEADRARDEAQWSAMVKRLTEAMQETGVNAHQLAKRLGRDGSYVYNLLSGKKKSAHPGDLAAIESILRLGQGELSGFIHRATPIQPSSAAFIRKIPATPELAIPDRQAARLYRRVNFRTAGVIMDTPEEISIPSADFSARTFALLMPDDSMSPRYMAGERVLIDPDRPITPGCFIAIEVIGEAEQPNEAFVRRFVSSDQTGFKTATLNPPKDHVMPHDQVAAVGRVVGSIE